MLNLFQNPFVKYFVCMGLRVKPSRVRKKHKTFIISDNAKPRRGDTLLTVCVTYGNSILHNAQSPARTTLSEVCKVSPHAGLMMYVCFRLRKFHFVSHTVNKVSFLRNFTQLSLKIKLLHEYIIRKRGRTILDKNFFRTRLGLTRNPIQIRDLTMGLRI